MDGWVGGWVGGWILPQYIQECNSSYACIMPLIQLYRKIGLSKTINVLQAYRRRRDLPLKSHTIRGLRLILNSYIISNSLIVHSELLMLVLNDFLWLLCFMNFSLIFLKARDILGTGIYRLR
jgi:hypothetical protein